MITDSSEGPDQAENDVLKRQEELRQLKFRLLITSIDSTSTEDESTYKRRGVDLKYIPHSSERIAKDFDQSI